jgi:hypothetical protein
MPARLILLTLLWLTACTPPATQPSNSPQATTQVAEDRPAESTPAPLIAAPDPLEKKMTGIAAADLSTRLSLEPELVRVLSAESITWPNAALGCPLPGEVYAEGTVPGFRIRLEAENKEYFYHTDRTGQIILCAEENPDGPDVPSLPIKPGDIQDGKPWVPVD